MKYLTQDRKPQLTPDLTPDLKPQSAQALKQQAAPN